MAVAGFSSSEPDRESQVGMHFSLLHAHLRECAEVTGFRRPLVSMKTLYSDFVVRELSLLYNDAKPLVLESPKNTDVDDNPHSTQWAKRPRDEGPGSHTEESSVGEDVLETIRTRLSIIVSPEEVIYLTDSLRAGENSATLRSCLTKPQRTEVHKMVRELLGGRYISRSEEGTLVIEKSTQATRRAEERRLNPVRTQKYLHFTLYKENMDSNHALREVASYLRVSPRILLFSGTKDKRAVTLQRVAVRGLSPARLVGINSRSFGPDRKIKVCSFELMDCGLRLGDAVGNHFLIALRFLPQSEDIRAETLRTIEGIVSREGVVNYFGTQRFGTTEVLTCDIGIQLLSGHFENAVHLVFRSKSMVEPRVLPVVEALEKGSLHEAARLVPHYCHQERDMINHLMKFPNDFLGSFLKIPRTMGMMYIHAVQSLVWNVMASRRLSASVGPLVGDLVLKSSHVLRLSDIRGSNDIEDEVVSANDMEDPSEVKERGLPEVVHLSATDVASGRFHLSDVLLPVPGPDEQLKYPTVSVCNWEAYLAALTSKGAAGLVKPGNPLVKLFHYHGAYRRLVVKPKGFTMRLCDAKSWRDPIIPTDLEVLTKREECPNDSNDKDHGNGGDSSLPCKAIVVEFSLPPGAYATCVLREFCECRMEGYHRSMQTDSGDINQPLSQ